VNQDVVINLVMNAMTLAFKVAMPLLGVALVLGLAVSIVQAVTQIQEQTLSFIPKILALAGVLIVGRCVVLSVGMSSPEAEEEVEPVGPPRPQEIEHQDLRSRPGDGFDRIGRCDLDRHRPEALRLEELEHELGEGEVVVQHGHARAALAHDALPARAPGCRWPARPAPSRLSIRRASKDRPERPLPCSWLGVMHEGTPVEDQCQYGGAAGHQRDAPSRPGWQEEVND